jgi:hypothetical protein
MPQFIFNLILSASLISVTLWIAKTNSILGGFVLSLPLSTLIVLALSKVQGQDVGNTFMLSKSIFVGVPLTLVFFIPFLLADKFKISFWTSYGMGVAFLLLSFFAHRWIVARWFLD